MALPSTKTLIVHKPCEVAVGLSGLSRSGEVVWSQALIGLVLGFTCTLPPQRDVLDVASPFGLDPCQ